MFKILVHLLTNLQTNQLYFIKISMKNLLFSLSFLFLLSKGYSQTYVSYYGTVVEQVSEANVLAKLTEFENLEVYPINKDIFKAFEIKFLITVPIIFGSA